MEQRTTVVWESPTFSPSVVMKAVFRTTQEWQDLLQHNYERLTDVYGNCYRERSAVLLEGLRFFLREMKETSVDHLCVFRSPARINLRGMHVDKHGGACNGVAINRETVFYATHPSRKGVVTLMNKGHGALSIALTDVPRANPQLKQGWEKYVYAAMQAAMKEFSLERGFTARVVSDIPQGSGLSSSHSFIVGLLCVLLQFNGIDFREHKMKLVRLAQATEFLTGTVTGLSDQGVILFSKRGSVTHANFYEADSNEKIEQGLKFAKLPTEARILVVDSHTPRCLSGDAGVDYAIPRFANSLSLHLLHDICQRKGMPSQFDRIASLPQMYSSDVLLGLIQSLPAQMTLTDVEALFVEWSGKMDSSLERYMNTLLKSNHQQPLSLRGPIMFSVAECSRADEFLQCLKTLETQTLGPRRATTLTKIGCLMNVGHEGDNPTQDFMIHDTQFRSWARTKTPIYMIPGAFKASTVSLDCIQQILLDRGAVGACLTGAGLGGCVVGLFTDLYVDEVVQSLQQNYFCKIGHKASTSVFEACSVKGASFL